MIGRTAARAAESVRARAAEPACAPSADSDRYVSNTALYADLIDGVDYRRRFRTRIGKTAIIAPHGGDIECGTAELCLAIAGQHPASRLQGDYGYWIFEGIRAKGNADLHVASKHCDDPAAVWLCGACPHVLSIHACRPSSAGLADDARAVLVGGRDTEFRRYLISELRAAGVEAIEGIRHDKLGGMSTDNIVNRTLLGMGGQLEISTPLLSSLFGRTSRSARAHSTLPPFWEFVGAVRAAIARNEQHDRFALLTG